MAFASRLRFYFQQDGESAALWLYCAAVVRSIFVQAVDDSKGTWGVAITFFELHAAGFYPGGHLKSVVCDNWPWSIAALQDNTRTDCAAITPGTLRRVRSSLRRRIPCGSYKTDTSLNTYCTECTNLCGIPCACVWFCGLATFCYSWPHCKLFLYEYIKKQWFSLLFLFQVVPVPPSLPLPSSQGTYSSFAIMPRW
jgi:hypothetical protein